MFALSRVYQFDEVSEMHDGIRFLSFLPQCVTALLPHSVARHAGHQARATGGPERSCRQPEPCPAAYKFMDHRGLSDSGFTDQQNTRGRLSNQSFGEVFNLSLIHISE